MKDNSKGVKIIQQLVVDGDIDNAFDSFQEFLQNAVESEKIKTEGLLLISRYKNLKREKLLGIASDADTRLTNLCHSLLVFLQTLESTSIRKRNEISLDEKLSELRKRLLLASDITELERIQHECKYLYNLYPDSFEASQVLKNTYTALTWHEKNIKDSNSKKTIVLEKNEADSFGMGFVLIIILIFIFFIVYRGCTMAGGDNHEDTNTLPKSEVQLTNIISNKTKQVNYDSIASLMSYYFLIDSIVYLDLLDSLTNNNRHDLAVAGLENAMEKTMRKDKIKMQKTI